VTEAARDPRAFFSVCGRPLYLSGDLLFAVDDDGLRPDARPLVGRLARLLREAPDDARVLRVIGHADPRGEDDHNEQLSLRRARRVADALIATGAVDATHVVAEGHGEREPIVAATTESSLQRFNRRVEVQVACPGAGAATSGAR
jgi:outer membrane protein OmpA-like peptidoglycan-associated protein